MLSPFQRQVTGVALAPPLTIPSSAAHCRHLGTEWLGPCPCGRLSQSLSLPICLQWAAGASSHSRAVHQRVWAAAELQRTGWAAAEPYIGRDGLGVSQA